MTSSSGFVAISSFFIFREKINVPEGFGILIIIIAVMLLSLCSP